MHNIRDWTKHVDGWTSEWAKRLKDGLKQGQTILRQTSETDAWDGDSEGACKLERCQIDR